MALSRMIEHNMPRWEVQLDKLLLGLRLLAVVAVLGFSLLNIVIQPLRHAFVYLSPSWVALVYFGYTLFMVGLQWRSVRFRRMAIVLLLVDILVTSLAVFLTGGLDSSLFVLYVILSLQAAQRLGFAEALGLNISTALLYGSISIADWTGAWTEADIVRLSGRLVMLLVIGIIGTVLFHELDEISAQSERERQLASRLAALNDMLEKVVGGQLNLDHVMHTMIERSMVALQADFGITGLFGEQTYSAAPAVLWTTEPVPPEIAQYNPRQVRDGAILRLSNKKDDGSPSLPEPLLQLGLEAILCVPLWLDQEVIGFLGVGSRKARVFTGEEADFLTSMGRQAAFSVRNARLYTIEKENVARLSELERMKNQFLSMVSHELRTPLTSIKTAAGVLLTTPAPERMPEEQRLLESISRSTDRLTALVSDLLEMTRIQHGRVHLNLQQTDLASLIESAISTVEPLLVEKHLECRIDLPSHPPPVWADPRRLEQVLINLLSNAQKYTPPGKQIGVRVTVPQSGEIAISVWDSGAGINSGDLPWIFDPFYRADTPETRRSVGTGLGLAIARALVELHGGQLGVDSVPGQGSVFTITLTYMMDAKNDAA